MCHGGLFAFLLARPSHLPCDSALVQRLKYAVMVPPVDSCLLRGLVYCLGSKSLLLCIQGTEELSGRALARILHGLPSSAFPAAQWKSCGYWGRYADVDFAAVLHVAEAEVKALAL